MRVVLQRVLNARVLIAGQVVGEIGRGFLVLLGIHSTDGPEQCRWMADKLAGLRIFEDDTGKMNRDINEISGSVLVVSQFTLYGDCSKGRRPSFIEAARPETAIPLYEDFVNRLKSHGLPVQTGQFGADMQVELTNDGPVTLVIDSP